MVERHEATELTWVFRPAPTRPMYIQALAGKHVHGTGPVSLTGEADVVLTDGTHVRATPNEIVAE